MPAQTKISSIAVENVRGIGSRTFVFDAPEMLGNKFHLLVAPNGFWKSSLAGAFESLRPRSLKLSASLLHKNDEANKAKLEITYAIDGVKATVKADEDSNEIARAFSVSVINSKLRPRVRPRMGVNQYVVRTADLIIEPVILVEKLPMHPAGRFKTSKFKSEFGPCGKILPNIEPVFENDVLLSRICSLPSIGKFRQKTVWHRIAPILADINAQNGTVERILQWIEQRKMAELRAVEELASIAGLLCDSLTLTEVEGFLIAFQLGKAYSEDAKLFHEHSDWQSYVSAKKRCHDLLKSINSNPAWVEVHVRERKGQLIAEFPVATRMSNGQRDLLSFVAQLMKAEFELVGDRAILVVDEVFDYLDECNLLAAQFYASRFVNRFKSKGAEIFPLFLTHLNPEVFKHSALGLGRSDMRRVHFLDKANDSSRRVGIAAMVKLREEPNLKPYIGKYFFHYHPQNCDQVALFKASGLKETWGRSHEFYAYVFEEFAKYRSGAGEADYVAASVAARIAIEKHAFDQIEVAAQKRFIDEFNKRTTDKLDFTEELGGKVPESHRLLGLLYNDILHHKDNFDYISAIVSKMKNPAIRGMMNEIPIPASF